MSIARTLLRRRRMDNTLALPTSFPNNRLVWTGRIISGLTIAFFVFDAAMKLAAITPVVEASTRLGFAGSDVRPIGAVLMLATLLYAWPRTAVLGALFVTAYLGGATATMVHAGQASYFPVLCGVFVWAGLLMRRPQLRAFLVTASK
ncbi:MAG: DoxX family protein [Kofleriaceae bacterium]